MEEPREDSWLDSRTLRVILPGLGRAQGYILLSRSTDIPAAEQDEIRRTLSTMARLIAAALENVGYRVEESLRARLRTNIQRGGL